MDAIKMLIFKFRLYRSDNV